MEITFAPRGILQIDNCRITHKNFSGEPSQYNRKGDRNFSIVIPNEDIANELIDAGWKVKIKAPREDGDTPFMTMPIKIKFNERGPAVYLRTGNRQNKLDEESIGILDHIDIDHCDFDIRPYNWEVNGESGRAAYLQAGRIVQRVDRFADDLAESEYPGECPFD